MFFNKEDEKDDGGDDTKEDPTLEFTLELENTYNLGDLINIFATIINLGEYAISIPEMDFRSRTIDYFIDIHDGYTVHWIGPIEEELQRLIILPSKQSIMTDMDITIKIPIITPHSSMLQMKGLLRYESVEEKIPYDFVAGKYSIHGYYKSDKTTSDITLNSFIGELSTPV